MSEPGGAGSDRAREAGWSWLHLPALAALAVAQPLLDLLSRAATFFVAHRFSRWEVVALVGLLLALPLPLVLLEAAVRRLSRRAARWLRLCGIAVLAGAIALQLLVRGLDLDGPIPVALAALGGIAFAAAYHRWSGVRQFTGLLALGLIAVPAVFFLAPEVRGLSDGRVPAAAGPALGTRAPIVMVVLDELSLTSLMGTDGRVDARRFPHFAALAERSTWFRNAVAASDTTGYALPAILSGRLPAPGDHALAAKFPDNLFTAFGREYRIYAVESLSALCPPELNALRSREPGAGERWAAMVTDLTVVYAHLLLPRSMREGLPEIESTWQGFGASEDRDGGPGDVDAGAESRVAGQRDRVADFRAVVDAIERREQPSLYFVHVLLPHVPWQYTASGKRYSAPGPLVPGASASHWGRDPVPVFEGLRRYLEQLQFVDALLGELLGKLEQEGLLEESALVVTADHGVSFRPGDSRRGLTPTNAVDILPIPLFVKAPDQKTGVVDDTPVSALSTLPTLFDVLGVRAPFPTDVGSALRPQIGGSRRVVTAKGEIVEVPAGIDRDKYAVVAERRSAVDGGGALPEPGDRYADLIGLAVEQLPREPDRVLAGLVVEGRQVYEDVDLTSPSLPVWVAGGVGESGGEIELVVAVNGIVSATTRARRTPDSGTRFATLVSERHLKQGANRVELFAVLGEGAARRLQRLVPASTLGRLELGSSGVVEAIAGSGGRTKVRRGDLRGRFSALPEGDVVVVSGWAWDVLENRPPAEIAVFSEGESVFSGSVTERRGGVTAGDHLPAKPLAGFRFEIPARSIPDLERTGVRVFARGRSGTASELEFSAIVSRSPAGPGERGGLEVRAGDGRRVRFPPGAISGEFERNSTGPGSKVELKGWAGDLGARAPAREVLVFAGSALLARVPVTGPSRLSESRRGAELAGSGFRHVARAPALAVENLGVYAISASGHAAALVERRPPTRLLAGKGGTPRALQRHGATSPLQSAEITPGGKRTLRPSPARISRPPRSPGPAGLRETMGEN
ncbi:MAG TPA: sulfatase-like hydrolase/transferase, partial [Thermoanaerobaculia bacterium]|nr:sulfatase-like hydrolase/transferase [Thermoanaerobaculia bacterium]